MLQLRPDDRCITCRRLSSRRHKLSFHGALDELAARAKSRARPACRLHARARRHAGSDGSQQALAMREGSFPLLPALRRSEKAPLEYAACRHLRVARCNASAQSLSPCQCCLTQATITALSFSLSWLDALHHRPRGHDALGPIVLNRAAFASSKSDEAPERGSGHFRPVGCMRRFGGARRGAQKPFPFTCRRTLGRPPATPPGEPAGRSAPTSAQSPLPGQPDVPPVLPVPDPGPC